MDLETRSMSQFSTFICPWCHTKSPPICCYSTWAVVSVASCGPGGSLLVSTQTIGCDRRRPVVAQRWRPAGTAVAVIHVDATVATVQVVLAHSVGISDTYQMCAQAGGFYSLLLLFLITFKYHFFGMRNFFLILIIVQFFYLTLTQNWEIM